MFCGSSLTTVEKHQQIDPSPSAEEGWRVLHVVANHEKSVAQHLTVRAVEHFLPLYNERSRWSDRTVTLLRPLFPGYVFARFAPRLKYLTVTTPGVLNVLGDERTGIVPFAEVERIQHALAEGYPLRPSAELVCGIQVRVRGGVFSGVEGIVADLRGNCRVLIRVSRIDRCFSLETRSEDLEVL